jgi:hypothetical protein
MLLWTVLNSIPLVASLIAWLAERKGPKSAVKVRSIGFHAGLGASTVGSIFLLIFSLHAMLNHNGMVGDDYAARRLWIPSAILAISAFVLSFLGSKLARLLGIASSLSLLTMLYLVGLATSY